MNEAIFFCIVGLPLFGKEGSGIPVFKILVRALPPLNETPDQLHFNVKKIGLCDSTFVHWCVNMQFFNFISSSKSYGQVNDNPVSSL